MSIPFFQKNPLIYARFNRSQSIFAVVSEKNIKADEF
jgi:hypothetical protein